MGTHFNILKLKLKMNKYHGRTFFKIFIFIFIFYF